jgi:hypothetical protein
MGEVYLDEDTRLDRKVAIKLLPAQLTRTRTALGGSSRKPKRPPRSIMLNEATPNSHEVTKTQSPTKSGILT